MAVVSMSYLLEAGVHFGHQTKRWNPKMKEYIFNTRDDIYIMDLQKTTEKLEEAYNKISKADAVIVGSPVYFGTVSAQLKCFFDKALYIRKQRKYAMMRNRNGEK